MNVNKFPPDNRSEDKKLKNILKLTSILLFTCVIVLVIVSLVGCSTLAYRYDFALRQLPKGANVVDITSSYIRYIDADNVTWLMYYNSRGAVYNVIDEDQISVKK